MITINSISELRAQIKKWKQLDLSIGLVPTMGFLHEGHESLIKRATAENDKVVVSIFVNPTQFGPTEDLEAYPRDINRDEALCLSAGASIIFNPAPSEMYPEAASTSINVAGLTEGLCGAKRPVHFGGVCLVVSKLFNIVTPNRAYFGEKDAQQLAVIRRMVQDLNFNIKIIGCPIVREADGVAKSSRNSYLSKEERAAAVVLNKSLTLAKHTINSGERDSNKISKIINDTLISEPTAKVDYIEIVDSLTLKAVSKIEASVLIAIAVYIGKTRLIDNFTFTI